MGFYPQDEFKKNLTSDMFLLLEGEMGWTTSRDAQALLLALYSRIIFGGAWRPYGMLGSNLGWPYARHASYPLSLPPHF